MSELKRKKNESFEAFIRRVKDQWKKSGKLLQARKIQFFEREPNKNSKRKKAVSKFHKVTRENYLRKIGKLPEIENNRY